MANTDQTISLPITYAEWMKTRLQTRGAEPNQPLSWYYQQYQREVMEPWRALSTKRPTKIIMKPRHVT